MWFVEHRMETTASPESIWRRWSHLSSWPEWNATVAWARLEGAPVKGTLGGLKFHHGPNLRLKVLKAHPGKRWVLEGRHLGLQMRFDFRVEASSLGSRVLHRVEAQGPLAWLWGLGLASLLREKLPKASRRLVALIG